MSTRVLVPGVRLSLDGCEVYIVNVVRVRNIRNELRFLVSTFAKCGDFVSRTYTFDVGSNDELIRILRHELTLFKLLVYSGVYGEWRRSQPGL